MIPVANVRASNTMKLFIRVLIQSVLSLSALRTLCVFARTLFLRVSI